MNRLILTAALAVFLGLPTAASLTGCGAQRGTTLVKLERDSKLMEDRPLQVEARRDGMVALYDSNDITPKAMYEVKKGDKLGFRKSGSQMEAFAGDNVMTIESDAIFDRTFFWKFRDEK